MKPFEFIEKNRQAIIRNNQFDSPNVLLSNIDAPNRSPFQVDISWVPTRTPNCTIPILSLGSLSTALNSRYDPVREAERIASELDTIECIILIGWEAGYLTQALTAEKNQNRQKRILVIEPLIGLVLDTLNNRDLSEVIGDGRVHLCGLTTETGILEWIRTEYQAHFFSSVRIFANPSSLRVYESLDLDVEVWVNNAVRSQQTDFLTQAHLGRRWMYNIFCNLSLLKRPKLSSLFEGKEIIVLGAGPSSESHVLTIRALQEHGAILFASDASIAFCSFHKLRPDLVLSIDGQSISYLHLLENRNVSAVKVSLHAVDLCSHPSYGRESGPTLVFGSRHPFIQLLCQRGIACEQLDTAGGNVGYSLAKLALNCGPRRVHAFGLDFSYTLGKPYLRPSFFYSTVLKSSNRLSPFEQGVANLWIGQNLEPAGENRDAYQTQRMQWYAQTFRKMIEDSAIEIVSYCPTWTSISIDPTKSRQSTRATVSATNGFPEITHMSLVMKKIDAVLGQLIDHNQSPIQIWSSSDSETRDVMVSLLPLLAWHTAFILKSDPKNTDISKEALQNSAKETRVLISNFFGEVQHERPGN